MNQVLINAWQAHSSVLSGLTNKKPLLSQQQQAEQRDISLAAVLVLVSVSKS